MTLNSQEHYDLMAQWEQRFKAKLEREPKELWPRQRIYCNGQINEQFIAFRDGYALAKAIYQQAAA
jgi:hypothetical protein